ncbi:N-acetylmuramoyl-L-alanine amidase [Candidatus Woesearchaeota archaeon]|nr:N-acetylmuramoyl-L-alanine amidase [Candidatus Woesearchaeota archaeon]
MMLRREFLLGTLCLFLPSYSFANSDKVLIIPGHDKHTIGTYRKGIGAEYELTLKISNILYTKLNGLEKTIARQENYIEEIEHFRKNNYLWLKDTVINARNSFVEERGNREITLKIKSAVDSYAVVAWAHENKFSCMVNVHVNDARKKDRYQGFTIITSNENKGFKKSRLLAESIYSSLKKEFEPSNNPAETKGFMVVNTILMLGTKYLKNSIPSVIVECGYIGQDYNGKKINDPEIQNKYAALISKGIESYFSSNASQVTL